MLTEEQSHYSEQVEVFTVLTREAIPVIYPAGCQAGSNLIMTQSDVDEGLKR